jgi:hypothetical protein
LALTWQTIAAAIGDSLPNVMARVVLQVSDITGRNLVRRSASDDF